MRPRQRQFIGGAACVLVGAALTGAAFAGGFGNILGNLGSNLKASGKQRLTSSKEAALARVQAGKQNVIGGATGGTLGTAATGTLDKSALTQGLKDQVAGRLGQTSPVLGTAAQGGDPKASLMSSIQARVAALKAGADPATYQQRLVTAATTSNPVTAQAAAASQPGQAGVDAAGSAMDRIKARVAAMQTGQDGGAAAGGAATAGAVQSATALGQFDLNAVTAAELVTVPGMTAEDANAVVAYRSAHGGAMKSADLVGVIGFKKYLVLRAYLTAQE